MTIESWSQQYGPVVGFSVFGELFVTVNGTKAILEALRKDEFQARPETAAVRKRSFGKSLGKSKP